MADIKGKEARLSKKHQAKRSDHTKRKTFYLIIAKFSPETRPALRPALDAVGS